MRAKASTCLLFAATLAGGCYHPDPPAGAPCSDKGECPSGLSCLAGHCEKPGFQADDAAVDACAAAVCEGSDLAGCGSLLTCALGCVTPDPVTTTRGGPHCAALVPSNNIPVSLLEGATADVNMIDLDFNTDTGEIDDTDDLPIRAEGTGVIAGIGFQVLDGMAIWTFHSLAVPSLSGDPGNDWDVAGKNTAVLFSATTIDVAGGIDAGADSTAGGPGGGGGGTTGSMPTCRGKAGLWTSAGFGEGGGGGGGRTSGGNGAPSNGSTFGTGGTMCPQPSTIPLRGGNGGGAGGVDTSTTPDTVHGGAGGGAGGGIALVAMESITISGYVTVPGDGGRTLAAGDGGGGGGSGGAILIEAPVVTITSSGALTAQGGGGGGPSDQSGNRGHLTDAGVATGGVYMSVAGGHGATGAASPTAGATYVDIPLTPTIARGGGGGGAAGRIEIKGRARMIANGSVVSPGAAQNDIDTQ